MLTTDMTTSPGWSWHPFGQIGWHSTWSHLILKSSFFPQTRQQPHGGTIPLHPFGQIGCHYICSHLILESSYFPQTWQQPQVGTIPDILLGRSTVILNAHILLLNHHIIHRHDNSLRLGLYTEILLGRTANIPHAPSHSLIVTGSYNYKTYISWFPKRHWEIRACKLVNWFDTSWVDCFENIRR